MIIVEGPAIQRLDREGWTAIAIGTVIATVVSAVPFLRFVFNYLTILIHEMGHALMAWISGFPAIPAFDFEYGGGVTLHGEQSVLLAAFPVLAIAWLGWLHRSNRRALISWSAIALALLLNAASTSIHEAMFLLMGHGTELIIAGVFLYRGLSGSAVRVAGERPLYAACGVFVFGQCLRFGYRLATDLATRIEYGNAKGGGHWMDFSRLAQAFDVSLQTIAWGFVVATVCAIGLSIATFRFREHIEHTLSETLGADAPTDPEA